jgi:hypothetical protein
MRPMHDQVAVRSPIEGARGFVDGVWECSLGGSVPVRENAYAELLIDRSLISDKPFLEVLEQKALHKVLEEGTKMLVSLTIKAEAPPPKALSAFLRSAEDYKGAIVTSHLENWNPDTLRFIEVTLDTPNEKQARLFQTNRGGLWLITQGLEATGLSTTRIRLPDAISSDAVGSLNHAFTKFSEVFEAWRISHTGNIYSRVLYQERNGRWYPLDLLRNKTLDANEREIAKSFWEAFLTKMMPPTNKKK